MSHRSNKAAQKQSKRTANNAVSKKDVIRNNNSAYFGNSKKNIENLINRRLMTNE